MDGQMRGGGEKDGEEEEEGGVEIYQEARDI